jgi:uncharacterized lipoprotein YddW (UPF0748 family)
MRGLVLALLSICCSCIYADVPVVGFPSPKHEVRAVWVTTLGGLDWPHTKAQTPTSIARQQRELCDLLDHLQAIHINTILLQTRVRGSLIYPSVIEPWDEALTGFYGRNPGYDPLRFAIEQCHRRGMELHAWVVAIPCFKVEQVKRMGKWSVLHTHPQLCKKFKGMWYLDPGQPATADYITSICREIVTNYDVDGIHFDYIRYPENGLNFPDALTYRRYGKGERKDDWRRDNITRIVRTAYRAVKAIKPWVKMSSSPIGKYRDLPRYSSRGWNGFDAVYQDAQGWLAEGIQDMLLPMMYFQGDHFYPFALDWQECSNGRPVAPGLGIYFLSPQEKDWDLSVVTRELNFLRIIGMPGEGYFRSKFLTDNVKGIYDYLKYNYYALPALISPMTWQSSQKPATPQDLHRTGDSLEWQRVPAQVEGNTVTYNVYASEKYPVDITDVTNLKAAHCTTVSYHLPFSLTWGRNFAVTAIDRYGNESLPAETAPLAAPASRLLPVVGGLLQVPANHADYLAVVSPVGSIIRTFSNASSINVASVSRGYYELRTLESKGRSARLGFFIVP